jgi:HEAT repeat protein
MAVRNIERELEMLSALRDCGSAEERTLALRKALHDKVNVIVAKAAKLVAEAHLNLLIPDLCASFERLLVDPLKTDPQCWGKLALAKALKDLGHAEAAIFLKGVSHVQLEPVWGGQEDTAPNVRATCAFALLQCSDLTREDKLWLIIPLLTDKSASVRQDAALALESLEGREAALLLRIAARMGDPDATVLGQVLESLLRVEGEAAVPFLVEFLRAPAQQVREEATLALGASRLAAAVAALKDAFTNVHVSLNREVLLRALAISRRHEAIEFLIDIARYHRPPDAIAALEALTLFRDSIGLRDKIAQAVNARTETDIRRQFEQVFCSP